MIEIIRIDHISQVVPDLAVQSGLLERVLGLRPQSASEGEGYATATLGIPGSSAFGWELMAPRGPESYLQRFLDSPRGPGLHHIAMEVPSAEGVREELRAAGDEPWDDEGGYVTYLHPARGGQGILFQFYNAGAPGIWYETPVFEDSGDHTLGIIAVNHVAHAHPDRDALARWYEERLGFEVFWHRVPNDETQSTGGHAASPGRGFNTRLLDAPGQQMRIEVLSPTGPDSFVQRFLDQRGAGMHHLTVEVGDWDRAVRALAYHGISTFAERSGSTGGVPWREAFIQPSWTGGVLLQFFWQAEPGVWT